MKKTLLSFLLLGAVLTCLSVSSLALPVDQQQARSVAATFLRLQKVAVHELTDITPTTPFTEFYVFTLGGSGFILVSADDVAMPILAYSVSNAFVVKDMPEHVRHWLEHYDNEIAFLKEHNALLHPAWNALMNDETRYETSWTAVSPLLTTTWNQSPYYNNMCPYDSEEGRGTVTGCVATATAQIMKFWNYPVTGYGSHSYVHDDYGTLSGDFGSTTYQWSQMPDALSSSSTSAQVNAVATLMYHIGIADEMNYGVSGSSAVTMVSDGVSSLPASNTSLIRYFKYCPDMTVVEGSNPRFEAILADEMSAGRPVLFSGRDTSGGHAFVLDGCSTSGQFHVNWGWGGWCDGYYAIGSLNPAAGGTGGNATYTFNLNNKALINIRPNNAFTGSTIVSASGDAHSTVTGSATYAFGDTINLSVYTDEGYITTGWSDNCPDADRRFLATGGTYSYTTQTEMLSGDTLGYCYDVCYNAFSGTYWGIKLPAMVLSADKALQKVMVHSYNAGTYTLNIYVGDSSATGLIYTQTMAVDSACWNTFVLDSTLAVDTTQPMWITFYSTDCTYPCVVSRGKGNSDAFLYGRDFESLFDNGYHYSCMIRGIFGDENIEPEVAPNVTISSVSTQVTAGGGAQASYTVTPNASCAEYDVFVISEYIYNVILRNVPTYGNKVVYMLGLTPNHTATMEQTFTDMLDLSSNYYLYIVAKNGTDSTYAISSFSTPMGGGTGAARVDLNYYEVNDSAAYYYTSMNEQTAYYYVYSRSGCLDALTTTDSAYIVNYSLHNLQRYVYNTNRSYNGLSVGDTISTWVVPFNHLSQVGEMTYQIIVIGQGVIAPVVSCATPITANLDTATDTLLSISWNAVNTATSYNISYAPYTKFSLDSLNWVYDTADGNTFTVSGLSPSTKYVFRISPDCTDMLVYNFYFSTECSFIPLPYTNTFDVPLMIHQPCWTIHGHFYYWFNSSGQKWPGSAYDETALAVLPIYDTTVYPSVAALRMKVSLKATNVDNYFIAGIMTDPSDTTTFVEIGREEAPTQGFADFTFDFSSYTGTGHYVAFRLIGADGVIFDNILLEETPACVEVTDLIVSNVAKNSAILQWSASYTASSYTILYRTAEATTWDTLTSAYIDTTATLTGLISNTEYNVTVFSNCGDNSSDAVSAVLHTKCENVSLPYSVDFAADPSMYHQYCWTLHGEFISWHNSTTFWPGTHGQPAYAVLPMYDTVTNPDVSQLQLSMTLMSIDTGNYLVVGVMDDPYDTNSFVEVARIEATVDNFVPVKLSLKGYSGSGRYVAFKALGSAGIIFDSITLQPTCFVTTMGQAIACDSYLWRDGVTYAASGTYYDTVLTSRGCDSVVTLNLTINTSSSSTDVQTGCDSYTWSDGVTYTASTSVPTRTLVNTVGCDSVVTLNLTINTSSSSTDVQTGCDSYTWSDGVTYTASTSVPTRTLANAVGCDSVVTLNLTINTSSSSTDVQTGCDSYTWSDGVTYTASTSVPTRTLANAVGCDSVVTLNLTINASSSSTDVQTGCDSYTWSDGVTYTASTSAPTRTLTNAVGCDSVVTLNLTINASSTTSLNETICEGDSYVFDGENVTSTGSYVDTLTNTAGCDSIVTLMLTVYPTYSDTIHAEIQEGETYNENGFSENEAGTYVHALQTMTGCDSTIVLVLTFNVGIDDAGTLEGISLYPNPTAGWVTIDAAEVLMIEVVDNAGRCVAVSYNVNRIDLRRQPVGNYILRITTPHGIAIRKVVRQ